MDIMITYETLFDLLRKERSLDELQELDPHFWLHVVTYLKEREAFLATTSKIEQEKTRIQLYNIKRIIREIYERRERKIMQLAMNVVRTDNVGFVDKQNMLGEEKLFFDQTLALLGKYKKDVLEHVCNNELPALVSYDQVPQVEQEELRAQEEDEASQQQETTTQAPTTTPREVTQETMDEGTEDILLKFISPVPKFMGRQKEIFGPYEEGAIASLPSQVAKILLKKEKAQRVMVE